MTDPTPTISLRSRLEALEKAAAPRSSDLCQILWNSITWVERLHGGPTRSRATGGGDLGGLIEGFSDQGRAAVAKILLAEAEDWVRLDDQRRNDPEGLTVTVFDEKTPFHGFPGKVVKAHFEKTGIKNLEIRDEVGGKTFIFEKVQEQYLDLGKHHMFTNDGCLYKCQTNTRLMITSLWKWVPREEKEPEATYG